MGMVDDTLFETCPNCDKYIGVVWDVDEDGYELCCPYCGEKMMICSMCPNSSKCDWDNDFNGVSHCMMMKESKVMLYEYIDHNELYRLYYASKYSETVAYVDNVEEAKKACENWNNK